MHWIYLIHELHNLSWITEINKLFHDILIYWDALVYVSVYWDIVLKLYIFIILCVHACVCVIFSIILCIIIIYYMYAYDTVQDSDEQTFWLHLELNASSSSAVVILHSKLYIFLNSNLFICLFLLQLSYWKYKWDV